MNKITLVCLALVLVGCSPDPAKYRCTSEQLDLVQKEFTLCTKSDYRDYFCFRAAKISQCDLVREDK